MQGEWYELEVWKDDDWVTWPVEGRGAYEFKSTAAAEAVGAMAWAKWVYEGAEWGGQFRIIRATPRGREVVDG